MASNRVPPAGATSATTSSAGIVQLTDSTSSTSTTTAATPNAVKSAFDLGNGAIAKTLTTTTGDIIYASSANTPARLGIGSANQVLTVSGGIPSWATPSGGSFKGVRVHRNYSGTPNIPPNTATYLTWMHDDFDTNNFHDEVTNISRFVMPLTGYYLIHAYVSLNYNYGNALGFQALLLRKNGSGTVFERHQSKQNTGYGTSGGGALSGLHGTFIQHATANDYFEIGVIQDTNGTVNANGGGHADSVAITYLGA